MKNKRAVKIAALFLSGILLAPGITAYAAEPTTAANAKTVQAAPDTPNSNSTQADQKVKRPAAPELLSVTRKAYNRLKLKWTKVPGANGYYVYRKTADENFRKIAALKGGKTCSYTDKTFICNTKYTYVVKAYKKINGTIVTSKRSNTIDKKSRYKGMQKVSNCLYYFDKNYKCYRKVDGDKKMICLTYDDGPSANTATILDTLKKYDSAATFFVVGNRVSYYKSTVKKIKKYHCQIGSHTYSHATLTALSISGIKSQMSQTDAAVSGITGEKTTVMRPPGGSYNATVKRTVNKPLIYWSIDTRDWATRSSSKTISAVLNNAEDGDIVLMHDLYESTATASKTIIPTLVKRGYQLVTIDEMAALRGGMKNGTVYSRF